jgi:D-beta-D-heptose 7-phosphate kinase/D-beta-D-heptose 1-phosphate adenosyltransferase
MPYEKIVWTNGCFDVLHIGHIELFKFAKQQGTKLYVGIDSDKKIKQDKGQNRPFNTLSDRINLLLAIKYIDKVIPFDSTEELETSIKNVSPDVMVIGGDWKGKTVVGEQHTKELKFFDRIPGYSTTKILEQKNYVS